MTTSTRGQGNYLNVSLILLGLVILLRLRSWSLRIGATLMAALWLGSQWVL